jgi:HD-like signal output (HDOD) protein
VNILLVDDEPRVLDGLERLLFEAAPPEWSIGRAGNGSAALDRLEAERYDVVVSDMRMPGMDGAELLTHVRDRWPRVVRIVLSGDMDEAAAVRAADVAHQFLTKPCRAEVLVDTLTRVRALRDVVDDERIQRAVGRLDRLPTIPRLFHEMSRLLASPDASTGDIAALIRQEPAISAKLLQLVNSSFFCRGNRVSDVRVAVTRLGLRLVRSVVVSMSVFENCSIGPTAIDALQRHSLRASILAERMLPEPPLRDDASTAALLSNVGYLAMAAATPFRVEAASPGEPPLHEIERSVHGVSHAEIGAYLLGLWALPQGVVEAVAHHHAPRRSPQRGFGPVAATYLASALAEGAALDEEYLAGLGVARALPEWRALAANLEEVT